MYHRRAGRAHRTIGPVAARHLRARLVCWAALAAGCGAGGGTPADAGPEAGEENEFANCTWEGTTSTVTPGGVVLTSNNTADLTGAFLGETVFDPAVQRKKIELVVDGIAPELMTGDAYLVRLTPTAQSAYLIATIKNFSQTDLCLIKGTNYRWLAADCAVLFGASGMETLYVNGAVRLVSSVDFSDSCLGPGETGTFTDVKSVPDTTPLYSRVEAVALDLTGPFRSCDQAPDGRLIPTAYDVGTCAKGRAIKVSFTNCGSAPVSLEKFSLSPAILLDELGLPLGWLYLEVPEKVVVAGGETATVFSSLFMEPRVRRIQIYVDFAPPM